jgi:hypothetical protein
VTPPWWGAALLFAFDVALVVYLTLKGTTTMPSIVAKVAKAIAAFLVPVATFVAAKYGLDLTDKQTAALTAIATSIGVYFTPNRPAA